MDRHANAARYARENPPPDDATSVTVVRLPWPPSLNNLFATVGRRRVRSARYEAWLAEAGAVLVRQRPARIEGPFTAELTFTPPDRRLRDLDGLAKAPLDLLVKHGVVADDSLARELYLRWSGAPPLRHGLVEIRLEAA
jgi:crossover junction endodeoxyribonuclease RusA